MKALVRIALTLIGLAASTAWAQLSCNATTPAVLTLPGVGFTPFAPKEQVVARGGNAGPAWEWAAGPVTNTQAAKGSLDWVSGRLYQWTATYGASGSVNVQVRDQGTLVLDLTYPSGMHSGNALKLAVKTNAAVPTTVTMNASISTVNGLAVSGATVSKSGGAPSGNDAFDEEEPDEDDGEPMRAKRVFVFLPTMSAGFTAQGTVSLTYATLPTGGKVKLRLHAGNIPCQATNTPPTVSISAPAPNATFSAPAGITVSADAADPDGTVSQVQFFANGNPIGTATTSPFSIAWPNVATGSYTLTAVATDNNGASTTSAPVSISVTAAQAKLYFIQVDHLNTPRLVADATGMTVWRWDQLEPFGNNPPDQNPSGLGAYDLPLRLPGQTYDVEAGLYYNYYRDYDPSLGTYKQSDLLGLAAGLNTYAYVVGAPLQYDDRLGLEPGSLRQRGYPPAGPEFCFLAGSLTGGGGVGFPHYFNCVNGTCGGFYPGVGGDLKGERGIPGAIKNDSADYDKAVCRVVETMCDQQKFLACMADRVKPGQRTYIWKFAGRNCRANAESDILDCRRYSCSRTSDLQL